MNSPWNAQAIDRVGPSEWIRVRAIRLRSLADAADAFGTTLAEDLVRSPDEWRTRLANPAGATLLARVDGVDVGLAIASPYRHETGAAGLFAMWVDPRFRRQGIGHCLVRSALTWAKREGFSRVLLDVVATNTHAIRLYESHGFRPTGVVGSLPPPRQHIKELQMSRPN